MHNDIAQHPEALVVPGLGDSDPGHRQTLWQIAIAVSRRWDTRFLSAGAAGHINVASGFGHWPHGQALFAASRHGTQAAAGKPVHASEVPGLKRGVAPERRYSVAPPREGARR